MGIVKRGAHEDTVLAGHETGVRLYEFATYLYKGLQPYGEGVSRPDQHFPGAVHIADCGCHKGVFHTRRGGCHRSGIVLRIGTAINCFAHKGNTQHVAGVVNKPAHGAVKGDQGVVRHRIAQNINGHGIDFGGLHHIHRIGVCLGEEIQGDILHFRNFVDEDLHFGSIGGSEHIGVSCRVFANHGCDSGKATFAVIPEGGGGHTAAVCGNRGQDTSQIRAEIHYLRGHTETFTVFHGNADFRKRDVVVSIDGIR